MNKKSIAGFLPLFIMGLLFLTGCLDDADNTRRFINEPFVCEYSASENKMLLRLRDNSLIYTPQFTGISAQPGACGIALSFIIDYKNQLSSKYYEVTNFEYISVTKHDLQFQEKPDPSYQDTLFGIQAAGLIDTILFIDAAQKVKKDQEYVSMLTFDPAQNPESDVFLLDFATKLVSPGTGTDIYNALIPSAFNISEFVRKYGIEQDRKELSIQIRYQKGWNENNEPVYETTKILSPLILKN